jgi:hypothetical protein
MGTATFSISKPGQVNRNVRGRYVTGGAHTTSGTASNLTDGAAGGGSAVSANKGDILTIQGTEAMRVLFGGETATATDGMIVFAVETADLEITASGTISIIDVA